MQIAGDMADTLRIRESGRDDTDALLALYPQAFPDEDLVPVVAELLDDPEITLALVATSNERIVGNVIFTTCGLEGSEARVALLAPLAVAPDCQRQGIGSALVRAVENFDLVFTLLESQKKLIHQLSHIIQTTCWGNPIQTNCMP